MQKPTMLYASPFNPMQSGISDYSEVLVKALQTEFKVTLLIRDYKMTNQELADTCDILNYDTDTIPYDDFDYIIYNIGNHPSYHDYIYRCCLEHPGMIILHDLCLYYLTIGVHGYYGDLFGTIYKQEGIQGLHRVKKAIKKESDNLLQCNSLAADMPLNKEILQSKNKFMVHSEYTYRKILETGYVEKERIKKINHIALIDSNTEYIEKEKLFTKFGIPQDAIIIASFGFISSTKLNHIVCQGISEMADSLSQKICYVMVGEGTYVDEYVDGKKIIKTGYTELEEFNSFIKYSDVVINLRHPSMGETSGALIRILGLGKVCIISNEGWFAEIPDECAIKIGMDNIEHMLKEKIQKLIECPLLRKQYEQQAKEYIAREYSGDEIVKQMKILLEEKGENSKEKTE